MKISCIYNLFFLYIIYALIKMYDFITAFFLWVGTVWVFRC